MIQIYVVNIAEIQGDIEKLVERFSDSVKHAWYIVTQNLKTVMRDKYSPWFFETPVWQVSLHLIYLGIRETAEFAQRWEEDGFSPMVLELIIKLNKLKSEIRQLTQSAEG